MGEKTACITLDLEPDLRDPQRRVRLLEDSDLMDRYVRVIRDHSVKVTGFVVTSLLEPYGQALERLSQRIPLEFGIHSHDHDTRNACSRDQVDKAYRAYEAFFGSPPQGYRAPNGLIDKDGINTLLDYQFKYDSSIFPSVRFDEYGYSNLRFPREPFRFVREPDSLVELPLACLKSLRLVFSLSYVKLLSLGLYRTLMALFPLPDTVVLNSHPYDYYFPLVAHHTKGWKRLAHLRNAERAFDLFEQIIFLLKSQSYEFGFMSEVVQHVQRTPEVRSIAF